MRNLAEFYQLANSPDWQALLTHFELGEGFAFIVLLVPDSGGAEVCREALERYLGPAGKHLVEIPTGSTGDLKNLAQNLLSAQVGPDAGAIWVARAVPEAVPEYTNWRDAWREAVAALNQVRNPLRRQFDVPLIFAGAPWLQQVLREDAPDLWSVRTMVAWVEPRVPAPASEDGQLPVSASEWITVEPSGVQSRPDPELALSEARKLQAKGGSEMTVAQLLERAGAGFAYRRRWPEATQAFSEAVQLLNRLRETAAQPDIDGQTDPLVLVRIARILDYLSSSQSEVGQWQEALDTAQQAVSLYRELAERNWESFLPGLAGSLNNLAHMFSHLGRRDEALAQAEEAVQIYRQLARQRPDAPLPDLAMSLNTLSTMLSAVGRSEEALPKVQEAVRIYRQLAQQRPDSFLLHLAGALSNLANRLRDLGSPEDALTQAEEGVRIYQQLAVQRPEAFLPDLAISLNTLASRLGDLGHREEALVQAKEAVRIYRQLAQQRPDTFRSYLAGALNNLANRLSELGRREEAQSQAEESARIYQQLAQQRPRAFLPDLAISLNTLATRLSALGRREEAMAHSEEAVRIFRQLAQERPESSLPRLAGCLNNLANLLNELGRREEAVARADEAVRIRQQLAQLRPDVFLPELAMSLAVRGNIIAKDRPSEALDSYAEAIRILTPFYSRLPQAHGPLLQAICRQYLRVTQTANVLPDSALLGPVTAISGGIGPSSVAKL